jgi:tetraacyldisaccharide 4'-kinase
LVTNLSTNLQKAWLQRGLLARILWPLGQLHAGAVAIRQWLYRMNILEGWRASVPVVIVGNVVVGGAGKTPLVIALVKHLQARGLRPGVVSRGYGRQSDTCCEVFPNSPAKLCGDEPLLVRQVTGAPVFVARRRVDAVLALLAAHPATDVIIGDDGLQHFALKRDLGIAVFDERGVGNGWLLPAGPLREKWPQSSAPVDLVLHTGAAAAFAGYRSSRTLATEAVAANGRRVSLDSLRGEALLAVAGIANPEAFFFMLRQCGLTLARTVALPDHASFESAPPWSAGQRVLCTEKDAVKLFARYPQLGLQLLAVPLVFAPEPAFWEAFDARLAPLLAPTCSLLLSQHGHETS